MVFNLSMSFSDDGETPGLTPVASPRACSGCVGVNSIFDEPRLQYRSRDRGAAGQMQDENRLGSNDSAGKVYGKKLVVKVDLHDDRDRSKAMRIVSGFEGIGSLSMDSKDNKLTVSGDFNPVKVVNKLRKLWCTDIVSVGAAKEDHGKQEEGKKNKDQVDNLVKAYQA